MHVFCLEPSQSLAGGGSQGGGSGTPSSAPSRSDPPDQVTAGSLLASFISVPAIADVVDSQRCLASVNLNPKP